MNFPNYVDKISKFLVSSLEKPHFVINITNIVKALLEGYSNSHEQFFDPGSYKMLCR